MARPFLSLILPVSEAAEIFPLALIEIDRAFEKAEFTYELLIIDDGSTDKTAEIAQRLAAAVKNAKVIENTGKRGVGTAMVIGVLAARGNWSVLIPRPSEVPFEELCAVMAGLPAHEETHILLGTAPSSFFASYMRRACSGLISLLFKSKIPDFYPLTISCKAEMADRVFEGLKLKSAAVSVEALLLAERAGFRTKQIAFSGSGAPTLRFADYLQTLGETIKIRWWFLRKAYKKI